MFYDDKLDLHGFTYDGAKRSVIRFIERNWDCEGRLVIVTGNSPKMKQIVEDILKEYNLEYRIGSEFDLNTGYIITWF